MARPSRRPERAAPVRAGGDPHGAGATGGTLETSRRRSSLVPAAARLRWAWPRSWSAASPATWRSRRSAGGPARRCLGRRPQPARARAASKRLAFLARHGLRAGAVRPAADLDPHHRRRRLAAARRSPRPSSWGCSHWACALVGRLRAWPLWSAGVWVLEEALRGPLPAGRLHLGPVGLLAVATGPLAAPRRLGRGAAGLSFAVALSGSLLAWALLALRTAGASRDLPRAQVAARLPASRRRSVWRSAPLAGRRADRRRRPQAAPPTVHGRARAGQRAAARPRPRRPARRRHQQPRGRHRGPRRARWRPAGCPSPTW